jgi:hypothetical protein
MLQLVETAVDTISTDGALKTFLWRDDAHNAYIDQLASFAKKV